MKTRLSCTEMGNRVRALRRSHNWSQETLAEKAGVSPQLISFVENGLRWVKSNNLAHIAEALDVSTDFLLWGALPELSLMDTISVLSANDQKTLEAMILVYLQRNNEKELV